MRVGNVTSSSRPLENGIPQGSPLSVLLFIIGVNSVVECVPPPVEKYMYVDDLVLFYSARNEQEMQRVLQLAVDRLVEEATSK